MLSSCSEKFQVKNNEVKNNTNEVKTVEKKELTKEESEALLAQKELLDNSVTEIMEEKQNKVEEIPKVVESDAKVIKKLIVLDPGHAKGGNRGMEKNSPFSEVLKVKDPGGASGVSTGLPEYEINMRIAKKLKVLLEKEGFEVIMTKNSDAENPGNVERAEVGNKNKADLVLRLHCDSAGGSSAQGASMLVPEPVGYAKDIYKISESYGRVILNNFIAATGTKNRGISKRGDLTGFNWSKVPVVLIEMGFMSNPHEDQMLASDGYENKMAMGLLNGIKEALK